MALGILIQLLFYQDNPDWAAVVMLILKQHRRYTETEAYQVVIRQWARIVPKIVEEGIASGEFKKDTDPYLVRTVVLGTIEHAGVSRLLLGRYENLLELVDPLTDLVIGGIKKEKNFPHGLAFQSIFHHTIFHGRIDQLPRQGSNRRGRLLHQGVDLLAS